MSSIRLSSAVGRRRCLRIFASGICLIALASVGCDPSGSDSVTPMSPELKDTLRKKRGMVPRDDAPPVEKKAVKAK